MRFRWSRQKLEDARDDWVLRSLVNERLNDLNPYGPFAKRLKEIRDRLNAKMKSDPEQAHVEADFLEERGFQEAASLLRRQFPI